MTIPRKTSTETKRGLAAGGIEVVLRTLVTAGELTAVTIFHFRKQMPIFHSYFDRNF